jgi:membrane-bound serine protease (ClpP class)
MEAFRRLARRARPLLGLAALLAAIAGAAAEHGDGGPVPGPTAPPRVLALTIDGPITGGTAEFVESGLKKARDDGYDAVAITLDTPGGALDATRQIVRAMLGSDLPVLVWVGPAGAHAGSAGVFITLAADVAAMHPTSNIGAAHPVTGSGKDIAEEAGKDMAKKVENDTAAFARSVAKARGRNEDWAEKAVRESVAVAADQALKLRVVDLVAPDLRAALEKADGRTVKRASGDRTFRGKAATIEPYEQTVRQRLLSFLADPAVVAILMLVGTLGIAVEFYHPGSIVPGVVGGFALLLAFLAMRVIPVNVGAVILILAGVGLLVAEAYVTAHGLAGAGGAVAIVVGMLFFVDKSSPDYRFDPGAFTISPWIVWPTPVALALVLGFMAWKVAAARRGPLQTGAAGLVGSGGEALTDVGPQGGEVFVHGEYWQGRSAAAIPRGARVRVVSVAGLTVTVVAEEARTG